MGGHWLTSQRHESGLILSQTLWKTSDDFDKVLTMITSQLLPWSEDISQMAVRSEAKSVGRREAL